MQDQLLIYSIPEFKIIDRVDVGRIKKILHYKEFMFLIGEDCFTVFDVKFNKVIGKLKLATQYLKAAAFSRDKTCLIIQDKTHLYKYLMPEIRTIHEMKDTKIMIPYDMPNPEDE